MNNAFNRPPLSVYGENLDAAAVAKSKLPASSTDVTDEVDKLPEEAGGPRGVICKTDTGIILLIFLPNGDVQCLPEAPAGTPESVMERFIPAMLVETYRPVLGSDVFVILDIDHNEATRMDSFEPVCATTITILGQPMTASQVLEQLRTPKGVAWLRRLVMQAKKQEQSK